MLWGTGDKASCAEDFLSVVCQCGCQVDCSSLKITKIKTGLLLRPVAILPAEVVTEAGHTLVLEASKSPASQFLRYQRGFHNLLAEPKLKESVARDLCKWMRQLSV